MAPETSPTPSTPVRVGIAGYSTASWLHAGPIRAAGGVVVAVATRNPERRAQAEAENPGVRVVDDLDALLREPGLDAVVLGTPSGMHHDHAMQVIGAGLPVVVEKPLGVDLAEVREVVDAARTAGVPLTCYLQRRWDSSHQVARELVSSGRLGDVYRFEFRWERWVPEPKHRWREDTPSSEGGGKLLDLGPHMVDLAVQLFGPVEAVYAEVKARRQVGDDESHVALHHAGGRVSHLDVCTLVAAPGPRMRLIGSAGTWVYDDFDDMGKDKPTYPDLNDAPGSCGWLYGGPHRVPVPTIAEDWSQFYRQLFTALRSSEPSAGLPVPPQDVVHITEVLDAALRSAETGQVVRLGE
ncbi:Predicted dehydrogenase [Raineyella antarctica]|uniref:Predicted dehydrogenase n=1 Tax=Raineyella antarctica TaxID=1577474 RepID=A0A1G6GHM1_9ACTN|nr:Gfo/Idh/MocA family oxidoreductase [Raineyella antarctica]SDB80676.1 Predicted dehydrogenase [Raineyella antarctica]